MPNQVSTKNDSSLMDLKSGEHARIIGLQGEMVNKRRLMALGIVNGKDISLDVKAPMGDPRVYSILGYRLTIRNDDARNILVSRS